jgi:hypothetical protein
MWLLGSYIDEFQIVLISAGSHDYKLTFLVEDDVFRVEQPCLDLVVLQSRSFNGEEF